MMKTFIVQLFFFLSLSAVYSQVNTSDAILYWKKEITKPAVWSGCEISTSAPDVCTVESIKEFIRQNLVYPKLPLYQGIQGRVWVSFTVTEEGIVTNVKLERGIATECDEEAIRIVKLFPTFSPALQDGEKVICEFRLAVIFELPDDYWKNRKKKYSQKALGIE